MAAVLVALVIGFMVLVPAVIVTVAVLLIMRAVRARPVPPPHRALPHGSRYQHGYQHSSWDDSGVPGPDWYNPAWAGNGNALSGNDSAPSGGDNGWTGGDNGWSGADNGWSDHGGSGGSDSGGGSSDSGGGGGDSGGGGGGDSGSSS